MEHRFNVHIANIYGVFESILISHIYWWIHLNDCNEEMFKDGRIWVRCSAKGFEKYFPYWSWKQIYNRLNKLQEKGVLLIGNYNSNALNHTLWYSFTDDAINLLKSESYDFTKWENRISKMGNSNNSIINNTLNNEDNKIEDNKKRLSNDNQKVDYSDDFLEFWKAYGYSKDKSTTYKKWKNLSAKDKKAAIDAIPYYFEDCKRCDRKKRFPSVYLSKRTWEDDFTSDEEKEETPEIPAADIEPWDNCQKWMREFTPRIADMVRYDDFARMRGMAMFRSDVCAKIWKDINASDFEGEIVEEFERLLYSDKYSEMFREL